MMAAEKIRLCLNNRKPKRLLNRKREKGVLEVDLITLGWEKKIKEEGPLARRMRPDNLTQFVGQEKIFGPGKPLRKIVESDQLVSLLFYGPPGTGKTSLAKIITSVTKADFVQLNAVAAGVKEVRSVIDEARDNWSLHDKRTILFIDEIHRFNKAQQDVLLSAVEQGTVIFIGATTENPSFELNNALLSRVRTYVLKSLTEEDIRHIIERALADTERGLGDRALGIDGDARDLLARAADGDARRALNLLEIAADLAEARITTDTIVEVTSQSLRRFDKGGDYFYDQISALHKSVRGSDPDAALYWYCRMLDGGCDPVYIARRVVRMASEDIGNADPRGLSLALDAWDTYERLGSPEGELTIAQAIVYLAVAPKSNAVYKAYNQALGVARESGTLDVPMHIRNAPTKLMKELGRGDGYRYAHDEADGYAAGERYLPEELGDLRFYEPVERGLEIRIREKLAELRRRDQQKGSG